jgi:hypothetical protein
VLDSNRISITFLIPDGEDISEDEVTLLVSITEEISAIIKEYDQLDESCKPKQA